jgi:hypothetical protein
LLLIRFDWSGHSGIDVFFRVVCKRLLHPLVPSVATEISEATLISDSLYTT